MIGHAPLLAQVSVILILGLIANCSIGVGIYLKTRSKMAGVAFGCFCCGGAIYTAAFALVVIR